MASTRNSSQHAELAKRVSACLKQHVRQEERLVVALSGGIDSVVLLHLLHGLAHHHGFRLSAFHVHHGLSPNADAWQAFCQHLCELLGIPLEVGRVDIKEDTAVGLEAAARRARYAALGGVDAEWLVLAHQRDDQTETLLFNLLRGAGLAGAAAMPVMRELAGRPGLNILRPLLATSRAEIERYAQEERLHWVDDESNLDVRHARNFLRRSILPQLRERFPGCDAAFARAASHFAEGDALLTQLAEIDSHTLLRNGRIQLGELVRLDEARGRNLLRHMLKLSGFLMPDNARLREAVRQACHAAADRRVSIDLGQCMLYRHRGELWLVAKSAKPVPVDWQGEAALPWGEGTLHFNCLEGGGISTALLAGKPVSVRLRRGGERFRPKCRRPRRELKKLLQEYGIPPWQRESMPLLWCGEELVWVPGIGVDSAWQSGEGETGLLPVWRQQ